MQLMNQKANDEDAFFIDYFKFYNSVSSIYSSKMKVKKWMQIVILNMVDECEFLPDLTKKLMIYITLIQNCLN